MFTTHTIILECFHLVILFKTLNKLIQEYIFLQEHNGNSLTSTFSIERSGPSPITHVGKSNAEILIKKKLFYTTLNTNSLGSTILTYFWRKHKIQDFDSET